MILYTKQVKYLPEPTVMNSYCRAGENGLGILNSKGHVSKHAETPGFYYAFEFELPYSGPALICFRNATRGMQVDSLLNVQPFQSEQLPSIWFAHNGTLAHKFSSQIKSDSLSFWEEILEPFIVKNGVEALLARREDMRCIGSRFLVWQPSSGKLPYFYGVWYTDGNTYSSKPIGLSQEVGQENQWWQL